MSTRRKVFYAFTVSLIVVLLALPATRWLVRMQLLPFTLPGAMRTAFANTTPSDAATAAEARYQRLIARSGNDFDLRFAHAMNAFFADKNAGETLKHLEALHTDYPKSPVVLAAILKSMMQDTIHTHRAEENLLSSPSRRTKTPGTAPKTSGPAQVAKFVATALEGESADPDNAYFPLMAAVGYFAGHQDEEATAAWVRAGAKAGWNDYGVPEITAKWKLQRALNGGDETGTVARMNSMAAIVFPQYTQMRSAARMAAVTAMTAELRGDKETGFVIRRASRQIGQNVQNHGTNFIFNLVGRAMLSMAMSRAGGAENADNPYRGIDKSDRWAGDKQVAYGTYLGSIGHPEEAVAVANAIKEGDTLKALRSDVSPRLYWGISPRTMQLFGAWFADFLLLAGVLFSLVFAGIFKLVYRFSPRLQKGEALQKSAIWGVCAGVFLPIVASMAVIADVGLLLGPDLTTKIAFASAAIGLIAPPLFLKLTLREVGHGLLVMLATIASLAALIGMGTVCNLFGQGMTSALGISGHQTQEDVPREAVEKIIAPWVFGLMIASVPLGLLALFGVFSRILRVPFAAGVTRGMRAMAVPLSCVLVILWSGAFLFTLHHERAAIREMERITSIGEMQYMREVQAGTPSGSAGH